MSMQRGSSRKEGTRSQTAAGTGWVRRGGHTLRSPGHDGNGRILAEVVINGRRIEQADIGPRAGRGVSRSTDHEYVNTGSAKPPSWRSQPSR